MVGQGCSGGGDALQAGIPKQLLAELEYARDFADRGAICGARSVVHAMPAEPGERAGATLKGDRSSVRERPVFVEQQHVLLGKEGIARVVVTGDRSNRIRTLSLGMGELAPPSAWTSSAKVPDGHRAPVAVKVNSPALLSMFSVMVNGSGGAA